MNDHQPSEFVFRDLAPIEMVAELDLVGSNIASLYTHILNAMAGQLNAEQNEEFHEQEENEQPQAVAFDPRQLYAVMMLLRGVRDDLAYKNGIGSEPQFNSAEYAALKLMRSWETRDATAECTGN
jgi:hypothetical protein